MESFFSQFFGLWAESPVLRLLQFFLLGLGALSVYFVFFTLRDIFLRSRSFWMQAGCILLVTAVPIVGFLLYLLIRPSQTLSERELHRMLCKVLEETGGDETLSEHDVEEKTDREFEVQEDSAGMEEGNADEENNEDEGGASPFVQRLVAGSGDTL